MSNIIEYEDITAFHPGCYVADIIEDMGITQAEFAIRMGTTPKTISKLVNGQCNLSNDLAQKLSTMLGTSVDVWLNLQKTYNEKLIEIEKQKAFNEQSDIASVIDYSYFIKYASLFPHRKMTDKIQALCSYLKIADLRILTQPDFLVNFRSSGKKNEEKNLINARAWLQTAINVSQRIQTEKFNAERLIQHIPEIRQMTLKGPDEFLPRLRQIFSECGVVFVLLPHLKNSGINGAVKWLNSDRVILAMNDRRNYADTFWFSLFHEIKHVLQQKNKIVFVSTTVNDLDDELEAEADQFARDTLIPPDQYATFAPSPYTSDAEIIRFAKNIQIHPGIVAGRLQHDGIIPQNRCTHLKEKYSIIA